MVNIDYNGAGKSHAIQVGMRARNNCRLLSQFDICDQFFATGRLPQGKNAQTCFEDGRDISCTGSMCDVFLSGICASATARPEYILSPSVAAHYANDLTAIVTASPPEGQTVTDTCITTVTAYTLDCTLNPQCRMNGAPCADPCHPTQYALTCTPKQEAAVVEALAILDNTIQGADAGAANFPVEVAVVRFCTGDIRYLLPEELPGISVSYRINRTILVETPTTPLHITSGTEVSPGVFSDFIAARAVQADTRLALRPDYSNDYSGINPVTGEPDVNLPNVKSPVSFYLYDHLGTTRVTFRADGPGSIAIDYAADYYPYAKILREYRICDPDRYLSTYHERDQETGYDNRGARLYDSEIGRFLGVDPLAGKFAPFSPYNYVLGNPVRLVDPDGRMPSNGGGTSIVRSRVNDDNYTEVTQENTVTTSKDVYNVDGDYLGTRTTTTTTTVTNVIDIYGAIVGKGQVEQKTETSLISSNGTLASFNKSKKYFSQGDSPIDLSALGVTTNDLASYASVNKSHYVSDFLGAGKSAIDISFAAGQAPFIIGGLTNSFRSSLGAMGVPATGHVGQRTVSSFALSPKFGMVNSFQRLNSSGQVLYDKNASAMSYKQMKQAQINNLPFGIRHLAKGTQWLIDLPFKGMR